MVQQFTERRGIEQFLLSDQSFPGSEGSIVPRGRRCSSSRGERVLQFPWRVQQFPWGEGKAAPRKRGLSSSQRERFQHY